jgi:hypothetical protein
LRIVASAGDDARRVLLPQCKRGETVLMGDETMVM